MNVLIVDDHPMMLEYLSGAVRKALPDAVVRTAGDLETALERAREVEPQMILVDLGLPGCGGIDSVLKFRAEFPQVPTAVVSANDDTLSVRGALAVGALLWIGTYAGLGYLFSDEIERVAAHARHLGSWLIGLVFASLVLYIAGKYIRRQRFIRHLRIARITPAELKGKLDAGEAMMIVDLRHPLDFGADPMMVPGAVHLNPEELERRSQEIPHDRDVVLYCT